MLIEFVALRSEIDNRLAGAGAEVRSSVSSSNQFETLCILDAVSQARQVAYNLVALETGQPKSPSGANEQY